MSLSKFIKYPLILGVVGAICAGALGLVYEITNPIIAERAAGESTKALKELVDIDTAEDVTATFSAEDVKQYKITTVYKATKGSKVEAYGYQVTGSGYGGDMIMLVVLSADEAKILGYKTISHNETNSGSYGGPLLNSEEFAEQFKNLEFAQVDDGIDFKAGSTAKVTLNGVKSAVNNAITFHQKNIMGEEVSTIQLSEKEIKRLALEEGSQLADKTNELKAKLGSNADAAIKEMFLLNYVDIVDSSNTVTGHAYICNLEINDTVYEAGNQNTKFALKFDNNWANSKLIILSSTESINDSEGYVVGPDYDEDSSTLAGNKWIKNFNGKSIDDFAATVNNNLNIDAITGGTVTSTGLRDTVVAVIKNHLKANA